MELVAEDTVTRLWRPTAGAPAPNVAQNAYEAALNDLKEEVDVTKIQLWLARPASIDDVVKVAEDAKAVYDGKSWKLTGYLDAISKRVVYYSSVLDALAQHHPEYVFLAWGAVKFVLMGVINHSELLTKFAKAFTKIGDALRVATNFTLLYKTDDIQSVTARLYLEIMRFCTKAVKWYGRHPIKRIYHAIVSPYALDWQDIVDQITYWSATLTQRSHGAMGAEIRDMHVLIKSQNENIGAIKIGFTEMERNYRNLMCTASSHKTLSEQISADVSYIKPRIFDLQASSVMQSLLPKESPEDVLLRIQTLVRHSHMLNIDFANRGSLSQRIQQWYEGQTPSLLIVEAQARSEIFAKIILIDVIKLLRTSSKQVYFVLVDKRSETASIGNTLKSLVHQALQTNPGFLLQNPDHLQSAKYASEHSDEEWLALLGQIYGSTPQVFLVFDSKGLYQQYQDDSESFNRLLSLIRTLIEHLERAGGCLKVLFVNYGLCGSAVSTSSNCTEIVHPLLVQSIPSGLQRQYAARNLHRRSALQHLRTRSKSSVATGYGSSLTQGFMDHLK